MATLTTKELDMIKGQLTAEENIVAKYKMYAAATCDPALKEKLNTIANKHQQHFDKLITLLQ